MNLMYLSFLIVTNPLLLTTEWKESGGEPRWSRKATVKIFNNEEEYNEYRNENQNA